MKKKEMDLKKLAEFFSSEVNLRTLLINGLDKVHKDGVIMDKDHILGFFPNGHGNLSIEQLHDKKDGQVSFNPKFLKDLLETAELFGAKEIRVSISEVMPLFIETDSGYFAVCPRTENMM